MTNALHPCVHCHRHFRASEGHCPFCAAVVRPRLALGALAVVGALALSGCDTGGVARAQDLDDPEEAVRQTPQYGAPSYDPGPPPTPQPPPPDNRDAGRPPPRPH